MNNSKNKYKILLTGSNGFVGARILKKYNNSVTVPAELVRNPDNKLIDFVCAHKPDIIINAAAISDISVCEANPDKSFLANVTLPVVLAKAAKSINAKFISFSTDQVYTGCDNFGPYAENMHLPTPTNIYACHKIQAENEVLNILPESVMLRATWMYDMPMANHNNRGNFFVNIINSLHENNTLSFPIQYRGITYVDEVVTQLENVFTIPGGIYNYGSENSYTSYETAKELLILLGEAEKSNLIIQTNDIRHNLWIDNQKITNFGIKFNTTINGLKQCISDYSLTPK
ncbi:MAG: sugar nucleotide-binding protein [Clostridia bacterium]|nr:sugar nucleotide-binding protein [Clostridia bacterium]